ncbi:CsgG/HfaB family protein [Desulfonatronum sp. SC1]|uniref:CsgG/HfaB family protein n=1 Tax=Desulfonatronum sp. SC1 TaxID=2109626 RepID=UPI001304C4A1|nr:CsgG/HfaB family protein [Desulfonatronum sp. SC1]
MLKSGFAFFPVLLLGMAFGLFGCAYVEDVPQRDVQYIEVPYSGQVPGHVAQDMERQYPRGFWEDRPVALGDQIVVAIKEFTTNPPTPEANPPQADLGVVLADMLADALVNSGQVRVVEREQMTALLSEFEISQSGLTATPQGYQPGMMHTVDYVITGGVSLVGGQLRVEARALEVLSGQIVASESMMVGQINPGVANALAGMLLTTLLRR